MKQPLLFLGSLFVAMIGCACPAKAGDSVLFWNSVHLNAIRISKSPPPVAARNLAIMHTAMYDTLRSMDKVGNFSEYLTLQAPPAGASENAAASGAAYSVLVSLYPTQKTSFDDALASQMTGIPAAASQTGLQFGNSIASATLNSRANDGANTIVPYNPGTLLGQWQPTPPAYAAALLPQWPNVTPFALQRGSQFRPKGPPALNSFLFQLSYFEVDFLGRANSTTRTPDQTQIARFWVDGSGTVTPPGHWNQIAQTVAIQKNNSLGQNARLFALLNVALADAGIAAWDAKYYYNFWRPVSAIQLNDPTWTPLVTTPPFPSYVSGHSTFSAAAATILARFFGSDQIAFTTGSDGLPGVTRAFQSFSQAALEAGQSRIYGGIHWQFDNLDGLYLGSVLGNYVFRNVLIEE